MNIDVCRSRKDESAVTITARRGDIFDIVMFASNDAGLDPRPEAAVASFLLMAMATGENLYVRASLDPEFRDNLSTVQDVFTTWRESLSHIDIHEEQAEHAPNARQELPGKKVAAFFSGGVDSFYTLLKRKDEIDALVYVHGFDVHLEDRELRNIVSRRLRRVAETYGKQMIEVETNLREATDRKPSSPKVVNWNLFHGSALASVAHLLSGEFDRIYIPATHTYDNLYPFGSHPLLDPLWSSSGIEIMHDGCEADRIDKCEFVAECGLALSTLRVCWKNPEGAYNCGRCEKCMRTMLCLRAVGGLDRCTTFDRELRVADVAKTWIKHERWVALFYRPLVKRLEENDEQRRMARAVRKALRRSALRRRIETIKQKAKGKLRRMYSFVREGRFFEGEHA